MIPSHRSGRVVVPLAIITLVLSLVSAIPARADLRIVASPGGEVGSYLELFAKFRETGQRVIIDGLCMSACTLVLSTIHEDGICLRRHGLLVVYSARRVDQHVRLYYEH